MKKTTITDDKKRKFLDNLSSYASVKKAAEESDIPYLSILELRIKDNEFAESIKDSLSQRAFILEDEALNRAINGDEEPVFYCGEQVGSKVKRSDSLLLSLLKANYPEKYGSKTPKNDTDIGLELNEALDKLKKNKDANAPHEA